MAITLQTLIKTASVPQEQKDILLARYDELSDDQKRRLAESAWRGIIREYQGRLEYETRKIMLEVSQGKREFNQADIEKIKTDLLQGYANKLDESNTASALDEVRQQLADHQRLVGTASYQPPNSTDDQ